jgi:hypothetical protein
VVVVPSPQPGCPRSLFGRLGIRKPSLLSLTSPHGHNHHQTSATATARTFSLDDLLKPPPRSKISLKPPVFFFLFKKKERRENETEQRRKLIGCLCVPVGSVLLYVNAVDNECYTF